MWARSWRCKRATQRLPLLPRSHQTHQAPCAPAPLHTSAACSVTPPWICRGPRAGAGRLTFVILGGMILFICMFERKERKQWPFGPWNMAAARAADKAADKKKM